MLIYGNVIIPSKVEVFEKNKNFFNFIKPNPKFIRLIGITDKKGGKKVRYEQWLKQIVVGVVETNQLSALNAKILYEKILREIMREKRKNNDSEN